MAELVALYSQTDWDGFCGDGRSADRCVCAHSLLDGADWPDSAAVRTGDSNIFMRIRARSGKLRARIRYAVTD